MHTYKPMIVIIVCFCLLQAKCDFVNDVASLDDVRNETEISAFKNESLGMAVLHLSHRALQSSTSLQEVAKHTRCEIHFLP